MDKKLFRLIKENTFEAPGVGSLNYGQQYGTPGGAGTSQEPSKFSSSDKTVNHMNNQEGTGSAAVPTMPERSKESPTNHIGGNMGNDQKEKGDGSTGGQQSAFPKTDRKSSSGALISPAAMADKAASEVPLNPDQELSPKVDRLFQKKDTPSPDEILVGLQYELGNQVKKDKYIAKQTVLKNLRKDPKYYSSLKSLNISDEDMTIDETIMKENKSKLVNQSTFEKTKALLDSMITDRRKNVAIADTPEITEIFKDLTNKRMMGRRRAA